jgi:hypothetical protein
MPGAGRFDHVTIQKYKSQRANQCERRKTAAEAPTRSEVAFDPL